METLAITTCLFTEMFFSTKLTSVRKTSDVEEFLFHLLISLGDYTKECWQGQKHVLSGHNSAEVEAEGDV